MTTRHDRTEKGDFDGMVMGRDGVKPKVDRQTHTKGIP